MQKKGTNIFLCAVVKIKSQRRKTIQPSFFPLFWLLVFIFLSNYFLIQLPNKNFQVKLTKGNQELALRQIKVWPFAVNEGFSIQKFMAMTQE